MTPRWRFVIELPDAARPETVELRAVDEAEAERRLRQVRPSAIVRDVKVEEPAVGWRVKPRAA